MVGAVASSDELRRQAALYTLSVLDSEPGEQFDRIARLAQRLLATRSAVVPFTTFCTHVIADCTPLIVDDASGTTGSPGQPARHRSRRRPLLSRRPDPFFRVRSGPLPRFR